MASTKDETMKEATLSVLNKYTPQNPGYTNPGGATQIPPWGGY